MAHTDAAIVEAFELQPAPPGAVAPPAHVSKDYRLNSQRLLVVLPARDATPGVWAPSLPQGHGELVPLFRWARANDFAVALFLPRSIEVDNGRALDRVLSGSPARFVVVMTASGCTKDLLTALEPVHPTLYSRMRVMFSLPGDQGAAGALAAAMAKGRPAAEGAAAAAIGDGSSEDLAAHILRSLNILSEDWLRLDTQGFLQRLFDYNALQESQWHGAELRKFQGLQGLKENDLPGVRRLGVDERLNRLNRDRDNDELARLLNDLEADEPGID